MKQEVLRMEHIFKSYGSVSVLKDFKLNLFRGEILGIVGLSGSGKTTILDIIAGNEAVDSGKIYINEKDASSVFVDNENRREVFCIQTKTMLVPTLSIAENIFVINKHKRHKFLLANGIMDSQTRDVFSKMELNISPSTLVQNLSSAERHLIELVKADVSNARILIIDEVIDSYSPVELAEFKRLVGQMRDKNVSFLILSNNVEALQDFVDRIVLLSDGENIKTFQKGEFSKDKVTKLLVGSGYNILFERANCSSKEVVFCGERLNSYHLEDISFDIKKGEIVGFFDVDNKSNMSLYNIIIGKEKLYDGEFYLNSERYKAKNLNKAKEHGIGFISKNSINTDVFLKLTYLDNLVLPSSKKIGSLFFIKPKLLKFIDKEYSKAFDIEREYRNETAGFFDIYTRQKIYLARWNFVNLKLLLCDRPFENVDIVTKRNLQEFFDSAAKKGIAVGIFSPNLENMLTVCDSFFVFSSNRIEGKYTRDEMLKLYNSSTSL